MKLHHHFHYPLSRSERRTCEAAAARAAGSAAGDVLSGVLEAVSIRESVP